MFELRHFKAVVDGLKAIEANEDMLTYICPQGLGDSNYIDYKNLRVYKPGTQEKTEAFEKMQSHQRLHGQTTLVVEGHTQ
jgi:hypothetical protein